MIFPWRSARTGKVAATPATWNARTDDFRHTPDNPDDDLQLRINPTVTRVIGADGLDYAQVVIQYEWTDKSFYRARTRSDQFTMLVAPIPSF